MKQLLFDGRRAGFVIKILFGGGQLGGAGKQMGIHQDIIQMKPEFIRNGPVVFVAVVKVPESAVEIFNDGYALFAVVFKRISDIRQIRVLIGGADPLGKGLGGHHCGSSAVNLKHITCIHRGRAFSVLRAGGIIQKHMGKIAQLLFRQIQGFPGLRVIGVHGSQKADFRGGNAREDPAGGKRILKPDRGNIAAVADTVAVRIDVPQIVG